MTATPRPESLEDWQALNDRLAVLLTQMRGNLAADLPLVEQLPLFREALDVAIAAEANPSTIEGIRREIRTCEALARMASTRGVKPRPVKRRWWR